MRHDGGDPERDDYGLPHVDVVVPDDARELERDLIAYRRELRRRRRVERWKRLGRPFVRHGLAVPIIAAALLVALVSGVMITVLGPRSVPQITRGRVTDSPSAGPGEIGGLLPPQAIVHVSGTPRPLADLAPGVIAIVPPGCRCDGAVAELAHQAQAYRLKLTLAAGLRGSGWSAEQSLKELHRLQRLARDGVIEVADDRQSVLAAYRPSGLTALFVRPDGVVDDVEPNLRPDVQVRARLERLLS